MIRNNITHKYSLVAILILWLCLVISSMWYYPKWQKSGSEATISWDVSGYYHYLPALFIYKDIKHLYFQDKILAEYQPTPNRQQSFRIDEGRYVMKYSCGQAIQMMPFFLVAHFYTQLSDRYPPDGYSPPYQLAISIGALIVALLGLILWRQLLLYHFQDHVVAITIFLIGIGSNYFEYAGITGAMTHNNLLMLYALLLVLSHRFYRLPTLGSAIGIGLCLGIMALTRPTELMACIIPLLYGVGIHKRVEILERLQLLQKHAKKIMVAIILCGLVGLIQIVYWKYVSGQWLVYSYEDQGFSWLRPHIIEGLFSYNNGWIPYSPLMLLSIIGLPLTLSFKKGRLSFVLPYVLLFIYVAFAWDIWWYGGSLGQRTMVQIYPLLSIPFGLVVKRYTQFKKPMKIILGAVIALFIYVNLWFVYQAHGGGMLHVEQMTKAYYWNTLGRWHTDEEDLKLLDNRDVFRKDIPDQGVSTLELITTSLDTSCIVDSSIILSTECEYSPSYSIQGIAQGHKWLRLSARITIHKKEWNVWRMPQMIIRYHDQNGDLVKSNMIRIQRFLNEGQTRTIFIDSKIPSKSNLDASLQFWNAEAGESTIVNSIEGVAF